MKKMLYIFTLILVLGLSALSIQAQTYTSYFTGNTTDITTNPTSGVCLMGGATEEDEAMKWFLQRADGGDVLVLRASGSDGYNDYMYSELGVPVNSVETIVFNSAAASNDSYIQQRIQEAEAIWFAGGDQWNYVSYWRNTIVMDLINEGITNRNIVVGGTSAGMAILGGFYFSAENGTVTSATALANPYDDNITVDSAAFISNNYLTDVITDTHYDDPDRKGRHLVFLARILTDYGIAAKGIACDEYTAVCISPDGLAKVYGQYPDYDDNAYFIQTNCELTEIAPESCNSNIPLDWNRGAEAIKVYAVKGTLTGDNSFDLSDWKTGVGGTWEHWWVDNGNLLNEAGMQIDCSVSSTHSFDQQDNIRLFPNPARHFITVEFDDASINQYLMEIFDAFGHIVKTENSTSANKITLGLHDLTPGLYALRSTNEKGQIFLRKFIVE